MLGFGLPGFWLLGLGLEAIFLFTAASSKRFHRFVDAKGNIKSEEDFAEQWRQLVSRLDYQQQQRLSKLETKCGQIIQKYQESQASEFVVDQNQDALRKLAWIYLKLLIAKSNLDSLEGQSNKADLTRRIDAITNELKDPAISPGIKDSKEATLEILQKRLENLDRREASQKEIESDLSRIEAQVDLALENVAMQGQPQAISASIDLFSHVLEEQPFGEAQQTIAQMDERIAQKN